MVIRDKEVIFFISSSTDAPDSEQENVCLWTNCQSLVKAFSTIFEEMWSNSVSLDKKLIEIETGNLSSKTSIISDSEKAEKICTEIIDSAKKEIIILTSSGGLIQNWRTQTNLRESSQKGVTVKILAPIVMGNLEAAHELSRFCLVKHVRISYQPMTIVDEKRLFQFKSHLSNHKLLEPPTFQDTFYSSDLKHIKKMRAVFNELWINAKSPSSITLEKAMGSLESFADPSECPWKRLNDFKVAEEQDLEPLTEKDLLNKIMNAKKFLVKDPIKDTIRIYGSTAAAVIHTPETFNLPDMIILICHFDEQSSSGADEAIIINLLLDTPKGRSFVPVAIANTYPQSQIGFRHMYANTPAADNIRLIKEKEIQIRIHCNNLFAAGMSLSSFIPRNTYFRLHVSNLKDTEKLRHKYIL